MAHERDPARPFDTDRGYSGQDYAREEERKLGATMPAGSVGHAAPDRATNSADLPPDNGLRAHVEPSGEVRGSGVGAGGGSEGEDYDSDGATGDGPVITGADARKPAD